MPILIGTEQVIGQAKDIEALKTIMIQIVNALNTVYDGKVKQRGDMVFLDSEAGPVVRRNGDGNYVRIGVTGTGSSATFFTDLGKELPERG